MKTVLVASAAIAAAVLISLSVVLVVGDRGEEDPAEEHYNASYSGLDRMVPSGRKPNCCSLMDTFSRLDGDDNYSIQVLLNRCNTRLPKSRNCTRDCSKRMWSRQSCKACCDFKLGMGTFTGRRKWRFCRTRCKKSYTCIFEGMRPAARPLKCRDGDCTRNLGSNFKCIHEEGYCTCQRDVRPD